MVPRARYILLVSEPIVCRSLSRVSYAQIKYATAIVLSEPQCLYQHVNQIDGPIIGDGGVVTLELPVRGYGLVFFSVN